MTAKRPISISSRIGLTLCLTVALVLTGAFPLMAAEAVWPERLVISTPASGVAPHFIILGLAKTIEANTPIKRVVVQPMGGPAVWAPLMKKGEVDMALHNGPDTISVVLGDGIYGRQGKMPFIRMVFAGSENLFMFYTVPGRA